MGDLGEGAFIGEGEGEAGGALILSAAGAGAAVLFVGISALLFIACDAATGARTGAGAEEDEEEEAEEEETVDVDVDIDIDCDETAAATGFLVDPAPPLREDPGVPLISKEGDAIEDEERASGTATFLESRFTTEISNEEVETLLKLLLLLPVVAFSPVAEEAEEEEREDTGTLTPFAFFLKPIRDAAVERIPPLLVLTNGLGGALLVVVDWVGTEGLLNPPAALVASLANLLLLLAIKAAFASFSNSLFFAFSS